ncbi:TAF4-domain-containing protein [Hesseltinella vesiculosa]|uniref:Transcription initiation factor TFIID subunit 4 n=1 Tax=Hesseltinella vesiculosa TaxID=101127 RepID=A0A1X2GMC4_9FUNG|nr:TAF4-domain-containing protein [Hesseltinella vesiculosa]
MSNEDQQPQTEFKMPSELEHLFNNDELNDFPPSNDFLWSQPQPFLRQPGAANPASSFVTPDTSFPYTPTATPTFSTPVAPPPSSMTLLESLTLNLPQDRKSQFLVLFQQLQRNAISTDEFFTQAKYVLDERGYQILEKQKQQPDMDNKKRKEPVIATPAKNVKRVKQEAKSMQIATPPPTTAAVVPPQEFKQPNLPQTSRLSQKPASTANASSSMIDFDNITDVMGYAGVDLKEETEHFMKQGDAWTGVPMNVVDQSKAQDFINSSRLQQRMLSMAKPLSVAHIDPDVLAYVAMATQDRLRTLVENMIQVSKHRSHPLPFEAKSPCQVLVHSYPKQALLALDRATSLAYEDDHQEETDWPAPANWQLVDGPSSSPPPLDTTACSRSVTVLDAIFALEREPINAKGSGKKTLLKMYNQNMTQ